ncbi:MAG: cellulase family glycosylhydrolase [Verrucomicrobiota bacterium]
MSPHIPNYVPEWLLRIAAILLACMVSAHGQLPAGWISQNIGSPGLVGNATVSGGTWTVSGGGSDIWGNTDQFQFASRTLRGDGSVIARVNSVGNTSGWAKSGVMIRSDATAGAAYADVVVTPANSVVFQWRPAAGASAQTVAAMGIVTAPVWVRVTRSGDSLSGSFSYDGVNWVQIGERQTVTLGASASAGIAVSAGNNAALSTSTFTNIGVVPAGWTDADIGGPSVAGAATFDGSALTVSGSGEVFGAWDQFHFVSQSCVGDVAIVAKVNSLAGGSAYAKAGVMIRDGSSGNASHAFSFFTPNTGAGGQGANFEYRNGTGVATQSAANAGGVSAPGWVKLVRRGGTFTAYRSADGVSWIQNGPAVSIAMGATVQVGVAVSAGGSALNTAAFGSVSVLPADWSATDIGAPGLAGSSRFDGLTWRVSGGGADVWGTADQFHFARQTFTGDVTLIAQVRSLSNTGDFAKAGLMIRDGTGANASYAFAFLTPDNPQPFAGAIFECRKGAGQAAQSIGYAPAVAAPAWLKLVRAGNVFSASRSSDGQSWTQMGSITIGMSGTVQVGLAVAANNNSAVNSAAFSDVFVGTNDRDPFLRTSGIHFKNNRGTGDIVKLRGTNLGGWMLHENWIDGMDSSEQPDDITMRNTLLSRFGEATANRLIAAFEDNWITELDLDNIRSLGLNVVRVPFSYRNVMDANFNWRSDAFTQLDWIVDEAWKRGIYVILDLHGAPGGASPFMSSGIVGGGALWTDVNLQNVTVEIWTRIAQHYAGHPGVAAYDLLNEPVPPSHNAVWSLYDRLYDAIRAVDPEHVVMMEGAGGAGVGNSYWSVDTLPAPSSWGWTNVAYQTHAYALDGGTAAEGTAHWQVSQLSYHGVPIVVGEFNLGDRELFGVQLWDDNHLSWTSWTYKARHTMDSNWGIYELTQWTSSPNLQTASASQILSDYATVTTAGHFALQPTLGGIFGSPQLTDDTYVTTPGTGLYANPAQGVLANDTDPNAGQPGITMRAFQTEAPAHGTLTLYEDGSFYYLPAAGFSGTDTFRYRVCDNRNDSANIATVSLAVRPAPLPAPWTSADVAAARTGWTSYNSGIWTVAASGADIWNTSDEFHFVSQDLTGEAAVIARVASVENTHASAKAGVMIRASTAADAPYAFAFVTPSNGVWFQYRTAAGASAATAGFVSGTAPHWVKVARDGNTFRGYFSTDGATWTQIGPAQTIAMQATTRAGLALTAHNTATLNTSTFTDLTILAGISAWNDAWFTPAQRASQAISGPLADANGDGVNNLLAYAAGLSPWTPATAANGGRPICQAQNGYLAITFTRLKMPFDLSYTVEVSGNLVLWNSGATYSTQTNVTSLDGIRERVTVRDNIPIISAERRYIRVRGTLSPP